KSYTADFKLCVVTYAKDNGNRAGRKYSVNEKSVWEWRKKQKLRKLHPRKRARHGKKAKWPNLEQNLLKWICAQRENKQAVSTVAIQLKARLMDMEQKIYDFNGGSENWVYKFMQRNNLSVCAQTSIGQRFPDEWEMKIDDFKTFVFKEINQLGLKPNKVIYMHKVPMSFDISATQSVEETGSKTVRVATTSHERTCFTVLACAANGDKLKPMVIFKRVTMPREKLLAGVSVICNKKGWMNTDVMKTWTDSCFHAQKAKSLLLLDSLAAHKETSVQKHINTISAHISVIPGGLTCKLQPLDMAVNHPFKCFVQEEWDNWMTNGEHTFTPAGRQHHATYVEVCKWVLAAWNRIKQATIWNGFCKCAILPDVDSSSSESDYDSDSDSAPQTSTITEAC
uniref:HTH CENPB-type domain-containing protein n=1 Tax=Pelodiscus sinensis TaxID=13735 RepID=K7FIJ0_PELSI